MPNDAKTSFDDTEYAEPLEDRCSSCGREQEVSCLTDCEDCGARLCRACREEHPCE